LGLKRTFIFTFKFNFIEFRTIRLIDSINTKRRRFSDPNTLINGAS
jgi:hypothetical protein